MKIFRLSFFVLLVSTLSLASSPCFSYAQWKSSQDAVEKLWSACLANKEGLERGLGCRQLSEKVQELVVCVDDVKDQKEQKKQKEPKDQMDQKQHKGYKEHRQHKEQTKQKKAHEDKNVEGGEYLIPKVSLHSDALPQNLHTLIAALLDYNLNKKDSFIPSFVDEEANGLIWYVKHPMGALSEDVQDPIIKSYAQYLESHARSMHANSNGYLPHIVIGKDKKCNKTLNMCQ